MRLWLAVLAVLLLCAPAGAEELTVGNFAAGDLSGWETKEFKGLTSYTFTEVGGKKVLAARADGTASGLFKEVDLDPAVMRYLSWSWNVPAVIPKGDALTKQGDDYPARIYVVFKGTFPWSITGINYIWANKLPQGQAVTNSFSDRVKMVAVRSGNTETGKWLCEQRDLYADYQKLFGEDPPHIGAVAVMTDGDNTGSQTQALYGNITLSSKERRCGE
jgi:hypothetical protein